MPPPLERFEKINRMVFDGMHFTVAALFSKLVIHTQLWVCRAPRKLDRLLPSPRLVL